MVAAAVGFKKKGADAAMSAAEKEAKAKEEKVDDLLAAIADVF